MLLDAADAGDATALGITRHAGAALGDYALAAARKVGFADKSRNAPFSLVLAGGVLRHPTPVLRGAIVARVSSAQPGVRPVGAVAEPVVGACVWALELAGIRADGEVR